MQCFAKTYGGEKISADVILTSALFNMLNMRCTDEASARWIC